MELYSAILETIETLFLYFEAKNTIFQNVLLTLLGNRFSSCFFLTQNLMLTIAAFLDTTRRDLFKYVKKVTQNDESEKFQNF